MFFALSPFHTRHIFLHSFLQSPAPIHSPILQPLLTYLPIISFSPLSLRADLDTLLSLREKLSLLWGSLEERKSKSSAKNYSSKPEDTTSPAFECCLKEYGIRSQRRKDLLKEDDGSEPVKEEDEWAKGGAGEVQDKEWGWERRWRMWGTTIS